MLQKIYTIRDNAAGDCGPLITAKNDAVAVRIMRYSLKDVSPEMQSEFQLLCLGSYETETGTCSIEPVPEVVIEARGEL
jgi:hypothetical protein